MAIIKPNDVVNRLKQEEDRDIQIKKTARVDVIKHFKDKVHPRLEKALNLQLGSEKFDADIDGNLNLLTYFSGSYFFDSKEDDYDIIKSYRLSVFNDPDYIKMPSSFQPLSQQSLFYLDLIAPFVHDIEDSGYVVTNVRAYNLFSLNSIQLSLTIAIPKGA